MADTMHILAELEEMGRRIARQVEGDRPSRLQLTALERDLATIAGMTRSMLAEEERRFGRRPGLGLAFVGMRAAEEANAWAERYRKHAPLRERQEHLTLGLEGAMGAIAHLRETEVTLLGPQLALVGGAQPAPAHKGRSPCRS